MYCIRCGKPLAIADYFCGCPTCLQEGHYASVAFNYDQGGTIHRNRTGLMRYSDFMPYTEIESLGEGATPIVSFPQIAQKYGLEYVDIKNEFQNPTGSHKDRTSPFVIQRAKELGISTVVAASSGNEGASIAAYAAYSGLSCDIVVLGSVSPIWEAAILATGARLVRTESPETRFKLMSEKVADGTWYPATNYLLHPVGSNSYGIQGYKSIAFEIFEHYKDSSLPDYILIPVSRGDLLWGVYEGFKDMISEGCVSSMPHMVAVEPIPRIEKVLKGADYRDLFTGDDDITPSIGGWTVTYQAQLAIRDSAGLAVHIPQDQVIPNVLAMAKYGCYLETSSAIILGSLEKLIANGSIPKGAKILMLATSHGFKNETQQLNL